MGRQEWPAPMGGEAVAEFFRALRAVAGQPTYRQLSPQSQLSQLSQRTHYPVATLSRAHRRTRADLPGGHSRLVTAYGRDPGTWRTHWRPIDRRLAEAGGGDQAVGFQKMADRGHR